MFLISTSPYWNVYLKYYVSIVSICLFFITIVWWHTPNCVIETVLSELGLILPIKCFWCGQHHTKSLTRTILWIFIYPCLINQMYSLKSKSLFVWSIVSCPYIILLKLVHLPFFTNNTCWGHNIYIAIICSTYWISIKWRHTRKYKNKSETIA